MRKNLVMILCILTSAAQASGPSFDCAKAKSCHEKAICLSPNLSLLDKKLQELYSKTSSFSTERKKDLTLSQKDWLSERNQLPCTEQDLKHSYDNRIQLIEALLKKDPSDYEVCRQFVQARENFKLISSHQKLDQITKFPFDIDRNGTKENFSFGSEHLGTCPSIPGSYIGADKKVQEIMEEDGNHQATFGIVPWFFENSGKLLVGEVTFKTNEDGQKSDRFANLKLIMGKNARTMCSFLRYSEKWTIVGKDKKLCELLSKNKIEKTYNLDADEIQLKNNKQSFKVSTYYDDHGTSAGCGSEIGHEYLTVEGDKALSEELKNLTNQEYWKLKNFSFVKLAEKNYLLSEPAKKSYNPRFDFPERSLYEIAPDGKISEVCHIGPSSKIRIVE